MRVPREYVSPFTSYNLYFMLISLVYRDISEAKLTGVGRYDGSATWSPPIDSAKEWHNAQDNTIKLPVMTQSPEHGRHGFILHNACWCILRKSCGPNSVPLYPLLEICESLPFPLALPGIYWGHDYGGIYHVDESIAYAWQEQFPSKHQPSTAFWDGFVDPLNVSDVPEMLSAHVRFPYTKPLTKRSVDCFASLPWEILEQISIMLSTGDALSMRSASASFLPLYTSEVFWASRFSADGERGFLFEATKPRKYLDWLSLYRLCHPSHSSALRNRQRIWGLVRIITRILKLKRTDHTPNVSSEASHRHCRTKISLSCDIQNTMGTQVWQPFDHGCRSFGETLASLPGGLAVIEVSITDMGSCTFVTGLQFRFENNLSLSFGYVAEQADCRFIIDDLYGFGIAVSASGIRAIRFVGRNGISTSWAGDPTELPVSSRLIRSEPVRKLAVTYDVKLSLMLMIAN